MVRKKLPEVMDPVTGEVMVNATGQPLVVAPTALVPLPTVNLGVIQADSPASLVKGAAEAAGALAAVIDERKLYKMIGPKKYVFVEGWTTLAAMMGCLPREVSCEGREGVYTAVVELVRMSDGAVLTRASSECGDEPPWNKRELYARRSMAITRATSKACRIAFSWIMTLAGYEATPSDEMPDPEEPRIHTLIEKNDRLVNEMVNGAPSKPVEPVPHARPAPDTAPAPNGAPEGSDEPTVDVTVTQVPTAEQYRRLKLEVARHFLPLERNDGELRLVFPKRLMQEAFGIESQAQAGWLTVWRRGEPPDISAANLERVLTWLETHDPDGSTLTPEKTK